METKQLSNKVFTPANIITFIGIILSIYGYVLVLQQKALLAFIIFVLAALTDLLDGFVAKNTKIVNFFNGVGESKLGKSIDPIRDLILRGIIFPIAYIADISLWFPLVILFIYIFGVYFLYARRIAKLEGKVIIVPISRTLMFFDSWFLGCWFLGWHFWRESPHRVSIFILSLLLLTALIRVFAYRMYFIKIKRAANISNTA